MKAVFLTALLATIGCGGPQVSGGGATDPSANQEAQTPNLNQNDIETGLSSLGPALVDCYKIAVASNRHEHGSVTISASIAPNGHVASATPVDSSLSMGLARCLAGVVASATFRAPGVDGVRVKIPLTFEQQADEKTP